MTKSRIIKITRTWMMLSFTAVLADLFYIIARAVQPVVTFDDVSFACAVPEMLEHMLLSVVIIAAFLTAMTYVVNESGDP